MLMLKKKKELEIRNERQAHDIEKLSASLWACKEARCTDEELIQEYENTWKSPDGQIILNDFQRALNLIVAYQGSLNTLAAPDPHVVDARLLLSKYGQKGLTSGRGVKGLEEFIQTREDEVASGELKP
jgi:hypothetical protein